MKLLLTLILSMSTTLSFAASYQCTIFKTSDFSKIVDDGLKKKDICKHFVLDTTVQYDASGFSEKDLKGCNALSIYFHSMNRNNGDRKLFIYVSKKHGHSGLILDLANLPQTFELYAMPEKFNIGAPGMNLHSLIRCVMN